MTPNDHNNDGDWITFSWSTRQLHHQLRSSDCCTAERCVVAHRHAAWLTMRRRWMTEQPVMSQWQHPPSRRTDLLLYLHQTVTSQLTQTAVFDKYQPVDYCCCNTTLFRQVSAVVKVRGAQPPCFDFGGFWPPPARI